MAENTGKENAPAPAKSKLKLIVLLVVVIILAIGLSVAGTFWFLGPSAQDTTESDEPEEVAVVFEPSQYYVIRKPLVSTVQSEARQRYAQIYLAFAARDKEALEAVELHLPLVRNRLLSVLNSQRFTEIQTPAGRDKLISDMLSAVNQTLEKEGEPPVEQILFRNFVLQ
jgi:flagellar FliL protein